MKKTNTLLILCLLCSLPALHAEVMGCQASDSTEFKTCLNNNETNIKIMADFTVYLTGFSLKGVTVDIGSRVLTITGNPLVDSTTVFNTSGAAGALIVITGSGTFTFRENTVHGGVDLNFLNTAFINPYYAHDLMEALGMALILPVSWLDFTARVDVENVLLDWSTATELNNQGFVVETSSEGEVFRRIGEIQGAGNSTEARSYRFTHRSPSAGVNYYRIKQVDTDGSFSYSKVVAVEAPGSSQVLVYPNPVKDKITLQYDQSKGAANIQLFDALGRRISATIGGYAGNYEIHLPDGLAKGVYWIKIERAGKQQTMPIVKE